MLYIYTYTCACLYRYYVYYINVCIYTIWHPFNRIIIIHFFLLRLVKKCIYQSPPTRSYKTNIFFLFFFLIIVYNMYTGIIIIWYNIIIQNTYNVYVSQQRALKLYTS